MGGSWCKSRRKGNTIAACKQSIDASKAKIDELEGHLKRVTELETTSGVDLSKSKKEIEDALEATKLTHARAYNTYIENQAMDGLAPILHQTAKSARDLQASRKKDTKDFDRVIDVTQQHDQEGDHSNAMIHQLLRAIKKDGGEEEEEEDELVGHYAPTTAVMMRDAPRVPSKKQQSPTPPNNNNLLLEIAQMN